MHTLARGLPSLKAEGFSFSNVDCEYPPPPPPQGGVRLLARFRLQMMPLSTSSSRNPERDKTSSRLTQGKKERQELPDFALGCSLFLALRKARRLAHQLPDWKSEGICPRVCFRMQAHKKEKKQQEEKKKEKKEKDKQKEEKTPTRG